MTLIIGSNIENQEFNKINLIFQINTFHSNMLETIDMMIQGTSSLSFHF